MPDTTRPSTAGAGESRLRRAALYVGDHLVGAVAALLVAGIAGLGVGYVQGWFSEDEQAEAARDPDGRNCPGDFPVKGNISEDGERIYHLPGWRYYQATYPDNCFLDAAAAESAGYRASKIH